MNTSRSAGGIAVSVGQFDDRFDEGRGGLSIRDGMGQVYRSLVSIKKEIECGTSVDSQVLAEMEAALARLEDSCPPNR